MSSEEGRQDKFSLANFPQLKGYIEHIGATQLNFRRYVIKEEVVGTQYFNERALIRISEDGEVTCNKEEYLPSPDTAEAIKREIQSIRDWPRSVLFNDRHVRQLEGIIPKNTVVYKFHVREDCLRELQKKNNASSDCTMIMCQVRYNRDDGGKDYIPWTYFDDGKWRPMEPDGPLPFFKPQKKSHSKMMMHEGPKSAMAAQQIVEEYNAGRSDHPWAQELSTYEHWGIIGGAQATKRADYAELKIEKFKDVVFLCDNDSLGKESATNFSRLYKGAMGVVSLDDRWGYGWDIADPMPDRFMPGGEDENTTLDSLIHPLTWATEALPNPDGKKPIYELTEAFGNNWVFCVKPKVFINTSKPQILFSEDEFNDRVRSVSDVKKTSELLINKATSMVDCLMYDPGKPPGIYNFGTSSKDSMIKFNMHVPATIDPRAGDDSLWLEYLAHMFPDSDDRHEVMRWVATLIARPDIKINYALLLISEQQGVGKSTLASYILAPLLGRNNVSYPEEATIVDSRFTTWQVRKRLAVVNEIYAGHSYKAYNRLKGVITEPTVTVEEKYVANYEVENFCHIFACSNDERAIKFALDDRRWLVPKVTEKKWPAANWDRLHHFFIHGGLHVIRKWADDFLAADPANVIGRGEGSPMTRRKKNVYETMLSDGERLVLDRMTTVKDRMFDLGMVDEKGDLIPFFTTVSDIREMIRHVLHSGHNDLSKVESAYRIKKLLKSNGYIVSDALVAAPGGTRTYLVGNHKSATEGTFREVEKTAKYIPLHSDDPQNVCLQQGI